MMRQDLVKARLTAGLGITVLLAMGVSSCSHPAHASDYMPQPSLDIPDFIIPSKEGVFETPNIKVFSYPKSPSIVKVMKGTQVTICMNTKDFMVRDNTLYNCAKASKSGSLSTGAVVEQRDALLILNSKYQAVVEQDNTKYQELLTHYKKDKKSYEFRSSLYKYALAIVTSALVVKLLVK